MRIGRFTLFIATLALVASGTLAGVALGSRAGGSPIEQAATKSGKASSLKFDFTIAITGGGSSIPGGKIAFGGTGAVDSKHKSADVKLDLSSLAPLLQGATQGTTVPKSIEVVVIGSVIYIDFPGLAKQAGAPGKEWVKFNLSALPKSVTGGVDPKSVGSVSPQQALAALHSALSVHKVGSDSHGTHYRANLNLTSLASLVPASQQASFKSSLAKAGIKTLPLDVWVGKAGYVSRFVTALHVKAQKGSPAVGVSFTMNLHDYGHKVHVTAPPASKTADGTKLISGLLSGLGGG
jgi:hypothetical protein